MSEKNLTLEQKGKYVIVRINRPDKLNALNTATITELYQAMKTIQIDASIRAVILTGSGDKAFAAGADISELTQHNANSGKVFAIRGQKVFNFIEKMSKPVIAAVNGYALGGGCELAMSCHLRLASQKAQFGQPEINLGLIPGYGGTQRLPRLIGRTHALYLLLTGDMLKVEQALQLGLVNEVLEPEKLMPRAEELATLLAEKAPIAAQYIIDAVNGGEGRQMDAALDIEAELFGNICETEDMKEGTAAFLQKRSPNFKGK